MTPSASSGGRECVIGVDPSIANTGFAVLRAEDLTAAGLIETSSDRPEPHRIWILWRELVRLAREHEVDAFAVESFTAFYRRSPASGKGDATSPLARARSSRSGRHDRRRVNPSSMYLMKAAQTAAQMAALQSGSRLHLYPVADWKGGASVSKEAIQERAERIYGVTTSDHNITDAIMIAHHHLQGPGDRSGDRVPPGRVADELGQLADYLTVDEQAP